MTVEHGKKTKKNKKKRLLIVKISSIKMFKRWLDCCGDRKKELIYKGKMLLRFNKRVQRIYSNIFDEVDNYYKENAKFEYKRMNWGVYRGRTVTLDFYSHKIEQNDAKTRGPFNTKFKRKVEFVYTGECSLPKNRWYMRKLKELDRVQSMSFKFEKLFMVVLEELDKIGALGKRPFDVSDCEAGAYV